MEVDAPVLIAPGVEALRACAKRRSKQLNGELASSIEGFLQECAADARGQAAALGALEGRLQGLRRRYEDLAAEELRVCSQLRERAVHVTTAGGDERLDRLVCEHLLRSGNLRAGLALAADAGCQSLVDAAAYVEQDRIASALALGDCRPAEAWCKEHRAKLHKLHSTLCFHIALRQFVELARAGDVLAAVSHAQLRLAPEMTDAEQLQQLQCAIALLGYHPGCQGCAPRHTRIFDAALAWTTLAAHFRRDAALVSGLTHVSPLSLRLQAGLCALNMPHVIRGGRGDEPSDDPLDSRPFWELAQGLPHSKHARTRLLCPITKLVMSEDNPPVALPNGRCYSRSALEAMAAASMGAITCPATGQVFSRGDMRPVFLI
jgi:macrophage erythroblast attacher